MNYSGFKEPTPEPTRFQRRFEKISKPLRAVNPSPQKKFRGLVRHWRMVKPALPDVKVNRIARLQPLPTFGRELSFRGPFHYSRRIAPVVSSMGLSFNRTFSGANRVVSYHRRRMPSTGFVYFFSEVGVWSVRIWK
ncbi:MAG: hypothetical protein WCI17_12275 [bacterium]